MSSDETETITLGNKVTNMHQHNIYGNSTALFVYKDTVDATHPQYVLFRPQDNHTVQVPILAAFEFDLKRHVQGMCATFPDI
jgi:hypothetical protein